MKLERAADRWRYWLQWALSTTVGFGVGGALFAVINAMTGREAQGIGLGLLLGTLVGASVGTAQWLVLRNQLFQPGRWVFVTTLAFAVIGGMTSLRNIGPIFGIVPGLGTLTGIGQWLVLRNQVSRAAWWVLASALGFPAAILAGITIGGNALIFFGLMDVEGGVWFYLSVVYGFTATGAVLGALTGAVLVWLLRRRLADERLPSGNAA